VVALAHSLGAFAMLDLRLLDAMHVLRGERTPSPRDDRTALVTARRRRGPARGVARIAEPVAC
jgi:hypothetical protein